MVVYIPDGGFVPADRTSNLDRSSDLRVVVDGFGAADVSKTAADDTALRAKGIESLARNPALTP